MNSNEIMALIDKIAATPGKNDKVAMLLAAHKDDEALKRVLVAALDPLTTYGVKKLPETTGSDFAEQTFDDETWGAIDGLRTRILSGDAAKMAIADQLRRLSVQSGELLRRILTKDLKAGFGESTVNKAIKGLIKDFPYMRCSLPKEAKLDKFDWVTGVISQEKADGMFINLNREADGEVSLSSRSGTQIPLTAFGALVEEVKATLMRGVQLHGELLVVRHGNILPREIGNGIMNHVAKGGSFGPGEEPLYLAWDLIPLSACVPKGSYHMGYKTRLAALKHVLARTPRHDLNVIDTRVVHSLDDAYEHYRELLKLGKEGTIIKDPAGLWEDKTSRACVKLKLEADCDLVIVGFNPGEGKNAATFGSVICRTSDEQLEVSVSGFSDADRLDIHNRRDALLGAIMAVKANGIMKSTQPGRLHSLFLPRCVELRLDKTQADSYERVVAQFDNAIKAA